jgi:hypothetical protein
MPLGNPISTAQESWSDSITRLFPGRDTVPPQLFPVRDSGLSASHQRSLSVTSLAIYECIADRRRGGPSSSLLKARNLSLELLKVRMAHAGLRTI